MDNLDKVSIGVLIILVASLVFAGMNYTDRTEGNIEHTSKQQRGAAGMSEIPEGEIKMLKDLIASDNIGKAEVFVRGMVEKYPFEGEPRMLMGDIMMRKQDPVAAIMFYKEAVALNPDYVDKKTPLFQGRKIKGAADEVKEIINDSTLRNSEDKNIPAAKKTMYYLLRKLAGSCG